MTGSSKTYKPFFKSVFVGFAFFLVLSAYFSINWNRDHYIKDTVFLVLPLIGLVIFGKAVLFCPHVTIKNNNFITIHYWFGSGHGDYIARSMYEIVVKEDQVRSFRFKLDNKHFQVSPDGYINGDELQKRFIDIIDSKKLKLSVIAL